MCVRVYLYTHACTHFLTTFAVFFTTNCPFVAACQNMFIWEFILSGCYTSGVEFWAVINPIYPEKPNVHVLYVSWLVESSQYI